MPTCLAAYNSYLARPRTKDKWLVDLTLSTCLKRSMAHPRPCLLRLFTGLHGGVGTHIVVQASELGGGRPIERSSCTDGDREDEADCHASEPGGGNSEAKACTEGNGGDGEG